MKKVSLELELALKSETVSLILFDYTDFISLFLIFKSILGDCHYTEQIWGTVILIYVFFSVIHHLFGVFSSNKDEFCLFSSGGC